MTIEMKKKTLIAIFLAICLWGTEIFSDSKAQTYLDSADSKIMSSDYKGAIHDCNVAIELEPRNANGYLNRGIAKSGLKDYLGAMQDFNKAAEKWRPKS